MHICERKLYIATTQFSCNLGLSWQNSEVVILVFLGHSLLNLIAPTFSKKGFVYQIAEVKVRDNNLRTLFQGHWFYIEFRSKVVAVLDWRYEMQSVITVCLV